MEEQPQQQAATQQQPEAHPARVQVSASKKPLHFYVELAKRFLQEHGEVQLSAIGLAIPMMVNLAEILKGNQWAVETRIRTGLDVVPGAGEGGPNAWPKAKMEIVLQKSAQFDALMAGGGAGTARVGAGARQGVPRERRPEQQQQGQGQPGSSSSGAEAAGGGRSGPTPGEASVAAPSRDAAPSSGPSP